MNRLLLRSTKSEVHRTRVDVLFQNVKALNLPTRLDGVVVTEAGPVRQTEITEQTGVLPGEETVFFDVESSALTGFVVAGVVVEDEDEDEDEGQFFEPSKYWPGPEGLER